MTKPRMIFFPLGGVLLLALDQYLKHVAYTNQTFQWYLVRPLMGWEYLANAGIAFSIPIPNAILLLVTPLIVLGLLLLLPQHRERLAFLTGAVLIIAGAISNFIDRMLLGFTIDYIRLGTAIFNLADVFILIGAILFLTSSKTKRRG